MILLIVDLLVENKRVARAIIALGRHRVVRVLPVSTARQSTCSAYGGLLVIDPVFAGFSS